MAVPRRTGTLLVYAGSIGLGATFLVCVYLNEVLYVLRNWHCSSSSCTVPAAWTLDQTRDTFLLWFGGLRSVLQIRAGMRMHHPDVERRSALLAYLVVAALDCVLLAALGELPTWVVAILAGWPLAVFALTRTPSVRPHVWEPLRIPHARIVNG